MVDIETARQLAMSLPEVVEQDHWDHPSFRIKKKIFATLHPEKNTAVLKLSIEDQSIFSLSKFYTPIKGAWGKQGWTTVDLKKVPKKMFKDSLDLAWCEVAPTKLVASYKANTK
jgi:hypothetical protein